jgi:DNA-binding FrmR family transcriptional regulator
VEHERQAVHDHHAGHAAGDDALRHARHTGQLQRLRRIEGQVRGIVRMVEQERYCVDILTQLRAARAALRRVEDAVLREHVEHCVAQAIRSGEPARQREKVDELLDVLSRFGE